MSLLPLQLRYINDQWDKDYREHQEVFRRFREDSHRAQSENESFIAVLKESKEQLLEQIRDLQYELDRSRKEVERIQQQQLAGHQNGVNPRRLKELEEENAFLRSQVGNPMCIDVEGGRERGKMIHDTIYVVCRSTCRRMLQWT